MSTVQKEKPRDKDVQPSQPSSEEQQSAVFTDREKLLNSFEQLWTRLNAFTEAIVCCREIQFLCAAKCYELKLIIKESPGALMMSWPWQGLETAIGSSQDKLKELGSHTGEFSQELKTLIEGFESQCPNVKRTANARGLDPKRDGGMGVAKDLCDSVEQLENKVVDMMNEAKAETQTILKQMARHIDKIRQWIGTPDENARKANVQRESWPGAGTHSGISPEDIQSLREEIRSLRDLHERMKKKEELQ